MSERDAFGNEVGDGASGTPTPSPRPTPSASLGPTPGPAAPTSYAPPDPAQRAPAPHPATRSRGGGRRKRSGWAIGLVVVFAALRLIGLTTHHTTTVHIPPLTFTTPSFTDPLDVSTAPAVPDAVPTTPGDAPG